MSLHERQQIKQIKQLMETYRHSMPAWKLNDKDSFDKGYSEGIIMILSHIKQIIEA